MSRQAREERAAMRPAVSDAHGTIGHPLPRGGALALRRLAGAPDAASWLLAAAHRRAGRDEPLLRWPEGALRLEEIVACVRALAARMITAGLRAGDVCVFTGDQTPAIWLTLLACWHVGVIAMPLSPAVSLRRRLLGFLGGRRIVQLRVGGLPAPLPRAALPVVDLGEPVTAASAPSLPPHRPLPESWPALILHSSGTTGSPKRILHDHGSIVALARSLGRHVLDRQGMSVLAGTPGFGFAYGLGLLLIAPLAWGRPVVLAGRRRLAEFAALASATGIDTLVSVPTGYRRLLADTGNRLPAGLRGLVTAGEPLDAGTYARLAVSDVRIVDLLGASEMLAPFAASDGRRPGLRALPGFLLAIRRGRSVTPPARGLVGEVLVRGPTAGRMATRADWRRACYRGWLRCHDLVEIDAAMRLQVQGRLDDIIIARGVNIAPREVEAAFADVPDLAAIAVTGLPDDRQGQQIVAVVVPKSGGRADPDDEMLLARLHRLARARLVPWKRPQAWLVLRALPMTATGKLRRAALRAIVADRRADLFRPTDDR